MLWRSSGAAPRIYTLMTTLSHLPVPVRVRQLPQRRVTPPAGEPYRTEFPEGVAHDNEGVKAFRGLAFAFLFSLPVWALIGAGVWAVLPR